MAGLLSTTSVSFSKIPVERVRTTRIRKPGTETPPTSSYSYYDSDSATTSRTYLPQRYVPNDSYLDEYTDSELELSDHGRSDDDEDSIDEAALLAVYKDIIQRHGKDTPNFDYEDFAEYFEGYMEDFRPGEPYTEENIVDVADAYVNNDDARNYHRCDGRPQNCLKRWGTVLQRTNANIFDISSTTVHNGSRRRVFYVAKRTTREECEMTRRAYDLGATDSIIAVEICVKPNPNAPPTGYIIMRKLDDPGKITDDDVATINKKLRLLNDAGVTHNDVKTANIMRCPNSGELMLIDFGSATYDDGTLERWDPPIVSSSSSSSPSSYYDMVVPLPSQSSSSSHHPQQSSSSSRSQSAAMSHFGETEAYLERLEEEQNREMAAQLSKSTLSERVTQDMAERSSFGY